MFSQSQMIIVHFPEWLNQVSWWCVCVFVWHQVLHCIKGSLLCLEASWSLWEDTAWCFVSSSLSCDMKCKLYRWDKNFCNSLINLSVYLSLLWALIRTGYEQDVEFGNTAHLGDCHGTSLIFMPCHLSWDTYKHTHTQIHIHLHTHAHIYTQMKHKLISKHTISLHTHTSNHSSNLPLHKSMCSINTHICIQYMATCNLCRLWGRNMDMYNYRSCSAGANGRGLKILDGQKMCLYRFYFKTSVPSFVPTKHDPGWTSVLIRTRGPLVTPVRKRHCQRVLFIFIVKPTKLHS